MIKKLFLLSTTLLLTGQFFAQPVSPDSILRTTMLWDTSFYDFGTVKEGKIVEYAYQFTNAGPNFLVISSVKTSCGCTVTEWPKDTLAPGSTNEIKVKFNTSGKAGRQLKVVRVTANTDPRETILQLGGEVKVSKRKRKHKS